MLGIDHMLFVDVKVKGVVRVFRVVRVAAQGFFPANHFAYIFDERFAFCQVRQREHALAMHARAPGLNAAGVLGRLARLANLSFRGAGSLSFQHGEMVPIFFDVSLIHAYARVRVRADRL